MRLLCAHDLNAMAKPDYITSTDGGGMSNNPSINISPPGKPSYKKTNFADRQ